MKSPVPGQNGRPMRLGFQRWYNTDQFVISVKTQQCPQLYNLNSNKDYIIFGSLMNADKDTDIFLLKSFKIFPTDKQELHSENT